MPSNACVLTAATRVRVLAPNCFAGVSVCFSVLDGCCFCFFWRLDFVKVEFASEATGVGEWMWVRVSGCDDRKQLVFGTLDSEPLNDCDGRITLGSELAVSFSQIREHRKPTEFLCSRHPRNHTAARTRGTVYANSAYSGNTLRAFWKLLLGIALLGQARDNRIIDGAGETRRRTGCAMGRRADSIYVFSGSTISSVRRKPSRVFFPSSSRSAGAMALTSMTRRARISVAISSKASRSFWSRSSIAFHLVWSISRGSPSRVSKTEQILFSKKPILNWNHAPRLLQLEKAHCHDDRVDAGAEGEDPARDRLRGVRERVSLRPASFRWPA